MDSLDFSRIQRVVLLIDLHPLLRLQNPNSYLSPVLCAARKILSFNPLSSSLFAFKLFFSSLSPVLSTSKVHHLLGKSPNFLSFDHPPHTLKSLSQTLNSLAFASGLDHSTSLSSPSASLLARSLLQLEHDYGWETHPPNPKGTTELVTVRSSLVVLFSPVSQSLNFLSEDIDLEVGVDGDSSMPLDSFLNRFFKCFGLVNKRLESKDIHISWIDVDFEPRCTEEDLGSDCLEKGIRELGWGFSSTDAIVLGSALVPFGLIFPHIGCAMEFIPASNAKKGGMNLILGISDVSGEPLECKICDLEVLDLKLLSERPDIRNIFSNNSGKSIKKIRMGQVWKKCEGEKLMLNPSALVLVHGNSGDCKKERKDHSKREFFADRVLELLCAEQGELASGKPIWQLLLAFLYTGNYWASVSISDSDGTSLKGILSPLTINYAVLGIVEKISLGLCPSAISPGNGSSEVLDRSALSTSKDKDDRRRRRKMQADLFQNATLTSFREVVFSHNDDSASGADLEELYFGRECNISKKLQFLRCWMRQVKKSSNCSNIILNEVKEYPDAKEEMEERVVTLQEEPGSHIFAASANNSYLGGLGNEEVSTFCCMEDMEAFLGSIPQKIEEGLCSEDADLGFLAERIVALSIHALYMKFGRNAIKESSLEEAEEASDLKIVAEIYNLLLRKPKDLVLKYKEVNPVSISSDRSTAFYSTENKIQEHELQILFRMEILRLKIRASIEEKQKMIKEICSLLQFIDINLQGDSFHSEGIVEFAERTIKTRYAHCLGDVIHQIYKQMEFDLFDEDEVEASDTLPSSNNDEIKKDEDRNDRILGVATGLVGAPSYLHQQEKGVKSQQKIMENVHERQLMKALERRNRDRKLSSFTSWMPDLQRVWALKQPKAKRPTHDQLRKPSKQRKQQVAANDMVCETPMTGKKYSNVQEDDTGCETNSCRSLSKALFHHEGDSGSGIIS